MEPAAPQAWDLERADKVRRTMRRLQGVLSPVPPDPEGEEVVQEEAEVREEEKRPKSIMRPVKTKEEVCPALAADIVRFEEGEEYNQTKILVQSISIKALRIYLTFRIQQLDSAMGVQGMMQALLNFFSNFTNVSDASIYFTQIDITNAYTTSANIQSTLTKHYIT